MLYRIFIAALILLSLLGVYKGYSLSKSQSAKAPAPEPLAEPARSPYSSSIAATGIIEAARENVNISTSKPGLVIKIHVNVGSDVKTGDPLFLLDNRLATASLTALQAQIEVAQAAIDSEKVTLAESTDQLARVTGNTSALALTKDELSRRRFAVQLSESRIARLTAEFTAAAALLTQAQTELEILTVRASRDGRILRLNIREGEYANSNPPEPLMVLGDIDTLQIRADVDEQNAPLIEPGQPGTAYVKGSTNTPLPLTFVRVDPFVVPKRSLTGESTERVDTRVLQVIFSLAKPKEKPLYVGQQVDVYIKITPPSP